MSTHQHQDQTQAAQQPTTVPDYLQLKHQGLSGSEIVDVYKRLDDGIKPQYDDFMGYQCNQGIDYAALGKYLNVHLNNIGDPFTGGNFTTNTKQMEVAVLDYFAELWHAKGPHNPKDTESYWGYVLSMGSTEGNMYALWQARDYLQGKILFYEDEEIYATTMKNIDTHGDTNVPFPLRSIAGKMEPLESHQGDSKKHENLYKPVAFFSEDTHYSVTKICRVLDLPTFYDIGESLYPKQCPISQHPDDKWPQTVPSDENGSVDVEKLCKLVEFFVEKGHPPLIVLNFGTTFKGAYDDVETIGNKLMPILKKYGLDERVIKHGDIADKRNGYWIHVDGALGGSYAPFLRMAAEQKLFHGVVPPRFDFALPFVHSINNSGHKWIGAPWPCGVFLTKVKYQMKPPSDPAYIGAPDTTFAGSRNGFSAMILWDHLAHINYDAQIKRAVDTQGVVEYAVEELTKLSKSLSKRYGKADDDHKDGEHGTHQDRDNWLWVAHTPSALAIRFRKPADKIVKQFSLSGESMYVTVGEKKVARNFAHIYIMHHVTKQKVDHLVRELSTEEAWAEVHKSEMSHSRKGDAGLTPDSKRHKREHSQSHSNLKDYALANYHAGSRGY